MLKTCLMLTNYQIVFKMFLVKCTTTHETIAVCSRLVDAKALAEPGTYITEEL